MNACLIACLPACLCVRACACVRACVRAHAQRAPACARWLVVRWADGQTDGWTGGLWSLVGGASRSRRRRRAAGAYLER
eukprot:10885306-Alexandrium_andersonii.AAC.1